MGDLHKIWTVQPVWSYVHKQQASQQEQIPSRGKADALESIQIKFEMILPGEPPPQNKEIQKDFKNVKKNLENYTTFKKSISHWEVLIDAAALGINCKINPWMECRMLITMKQYICIYSIRHSSYCLWSS